MKSTCLAISLTGLALPAFAVDLGDTDKAIKLAINDWAGQQITTHIAGDMLEAAGYKVEYVPVEYDAMFREMIKDNVDAALEIWRATAVIRFTDYVRSATWALPRKKAWPTRRSWRQNAPACLTGKRCATAPTRLPPMARLNCSTIPKTGRPPAQI
jgi:hypothetical protein